MTTRARMGVIAVFLLFFFCIVPELVIRIGELGWTLLFGWIPSGVRFLKMLPQVRGNVWLFSAGCIAFLGGAHLFCCWIARHNIELKGKWMVQHTSTILGGASLILFAVMGFLGVAHQLGWLIVSREPLLVSRTSVRLERIALTQALKGLQLEAELNQWQVEDVRRVFYQQFPDYFKRKKQPFWEKYNLILLSSTNGLISAMELMPIDRIIRENYGVGLVERGGEPHLIKMEEAKRLAATPSKE